MLACLFLISNQLVRVVLKKFDKKIEEAKGIKKEDKVSYINRLENIINQKDSYKGYLDKLQDRLDKYGNPLKLSPVTYLLIKYTGILVALGFGLYNKANLILLIIEAVAIYYSLDIVNYLSNVDDNKKIIMDLPDICDVLNVQNYAGVSLGKALTEVYDIPRNKRLRDALDKLAGEINLTKNPQAALDKFSNKFHNMFELESFVVSLKQALRTGKSRDILDNQSDILKENILYMIDDETKRIDTIKIMILTFLVFSGIVALIFFSFKIQMQDGFHQIFS